MPRIHITLNINSKNQLSMNNSITKPVSREMISLFEDYIKVVLNRVKQDATFETADEIDGISDKLKT